MAFEQNQRISEVIKREGSRLPNFIRRRVPDPRDAEDIPQDVFWTSGAVPDPFGGSGFHGSGSSDYRRRMKERWERMTPEQRERLRQSWRRRWGFVPPAGVSKQP